MPVPTLLRDMVRHAELESEMPYAWRHLLHNCKQFLFFTCLCCHAKGGPFDSQHMGRCSMDSISALAKPYIACKRQMADEG